MKLQMKQFTYHFNFTIIRNLFKLIIWGILCCILLLMLFLFINERNNILNKHFTDAFLSSNGTEYYTINQIRNAIGRGQINNSSDIINAYNWLNLHTPPGTFFLIDLSSLYFKWLPIPKSLPPVDAWNLRWNNITLSYSYFFITFLIAFVGLIMLLIVYILNFINTRRYKKYKLTNNYFKNSFFYNNFYIDNITQFILSLAMVFAFFNFISTIIVFLYIVLLKILNFIGKKYKTFDTGLEFSLANDIYLFSVMIFTNGYALTKSYFVNTFGVNLDLLMSLILPIGTITLIIGLFVKNLLDSKITSINKKIKNINQTIDSINTLMITTGVDAFKDSGFVAILPSNYLNLIRNNSSIINVFDLLKKNIDLTTKIKQLKINKKQSLYLMYLAIYCCNSESEYNEFLSNYNNYYVNNNAKSNS